MRELIRGWRRKMGVVTLAVACMFMAGWVRSQTIEDEFMFGSGEGKWFHTLSSSPNGIKWEKDSSDRVFHWLNGWSCVSARLTDHHDPTKGYVDPKTIDWRWELCGIDFGGFHDQKNSTERVVWWLVPYWSIVVPLIAISAVLLLTKPRQSTPKKFAEPSANKGT